MALAVRDRDERLEQPLENEIDPELQQELLAHPGKWTAITRSRLLAVGSSPAVVLKAAREAGVDSPILYRVPADSRTTYFF